MRAILTNPRYLGYHVSGRTQKSDRLLDPDNPNRGHVTRQVWQDSSDWVTATVQTYEAIIDESTWQQVQSTIATYAHSKPKAIVSEGGLQPSSVGCNLFHLWVATYST